MIIRIIGDNWVPEDKVLISVREDDAVSSSLPNIMKKLSIKRMGDFKVYHAVRERKCDYDRPIDYKCTWRQLGISGGSAIYLSKKEPPSLEEAPTAADNEQNKKQNEGASVDVPLEHKAADPGDVPSSFDSAQVERGAYVDLISQPPHGSSPTCKTTVEPLLTQPPQQPELKISVPPVQPYDGEVKTDLIVSNTSHAGFGQKQHENLLPVDKINSLRVNRPEFEVKDGGGIPFTPDINHRTTYDFQIPASRVQEESRANIVESNVTLRRCERAAYVISLYEFAHLESQRQLRRAEELRREAQRGVPRSQLTISEPLYRI
ncbi:hypothetical protein DQ04_04791070 [Trypanosoma grayi]|uniref:hypothetical protein n=1 Tax=Trypanosoma grayi TaxID=71804 RepID=UPI0004F48F74|nr:hypothetical protein DQ04_04791070 [Trypanosoma grayi]KEG09704.1 hypothetical protein DQ04_04791070 [Trypanosoma grayi]